MDLLLYAVGKFCYDSSEEEIEKVEILPSQCPSIFRLSNLIHLKNLNLRPRRGESHLIGLLHKFASSSTSHLDGQVGWSPHLLLLPMARQPWPLAHSCITHNRVVGYAKQMQFDEELQIKISTST